MGICLVHEADESLTSTQKPVSALLARPKGIMIVRFTDYIRSLYCTSGRWWLE